MSTATMLEPKRRGPRKPPAEKCERCNREIVGHSTFILIEAGMGAAGRRIQLCSNCGISLDAWINREPSR